MRFGRLLVSSALVLGWVSIAHGAKVPEAEASLRVAVIGDINSSYGSLEYSPRVHAALSRIVELAPDLVIGVGDLVAGQRPRPPLDRDSLEAMWRQFRRTVLEPLHEAGIPFAPVPGNHDASALPGFELERRIFGQFWGRHRPTLDLLEGGSYPFRYAFVVSGNLFVVLDATVGGPLAETQRRWLEDVLRGGESHGARVAAAHLPLHPFTHGREHEFLADPALEGLLSETGVDLFLSGHHHAFYPGFRAGFMQVSQGCLGSGPRRLLGENRRSPQSFTMITIHSSGKVSVRALTGTDFNEVVDLRDLPPRLRHAGREIVREDLVRPAHAAK